MPIPGSSENGGRSGPSGRTDGNRTREPVEGPVPNNADRRLPVDPSRTLSAPDGLLDVVADPVFAWRTMRGGIVSWNRAAERLYGYTYQEALGRISHDVLRTEFRAG